MKKLQIGDTVTVTKRKKGYYSACGGNPECYLEPGERGAIVAVRVPKLRKTPGGDYFCCIDYEKYGKIWRTSSNYADIMKIKS